MYLTCPGCETVYVVRAAMLRDGQGEVRCGTCRTVFNGLDYLVDELPENAPEPTDSAAPDRPASVGDTLPDVLHDDASAQQPDASPTARHTGLWIAAAVLLLAVAFQYLWFAPRDLAKRFPQVRNVVEQFCLEVGCLARASRAPQRIRMISRDVRAHPRYEGALLVTATFSNTATWAQPFPALRFSLYDVNGQTIAARTFSPAQYLAGVLPADATLPPGQPVQVALEMLAPEEAAVSYEFTFL